jgi:hypothetical protein
MLHPPAGIPDEQKGSRPISCWRRDLTTFVTGRGHRNVGSGPRRPRSPLLATLTTRCHRLRPLGSNKCSIPEPAIPHVESVSSPAACLTLIRTRRYYRGGHPRTSHRRDVRHGARRSRPTTSRGLAEIGGDDLANPHSDRRRDDEPLRDWIVQEQSHHAELIARHGTGDAR